MDSLVCLPIIFLGETIHSHSHNQHHDIKIWYQKPLLKFRGPSLSWKSSGAQNVTVTLVAANIPLDRCGQKDDGHDKVWNQILNASQSEWKSHCGCTDLKMKINAAIMICKDEIMSPGPKVLFIIWIIWIILGKNPLVCADDILPFFMIEPMGGDRFRPIRADDSMWCVNSIWGPRGKRGQYIGGRKINLPSHLVCHRCKGY